MRSGDLQQKYRQVATVTTASMNMNAPIEKAADNDIESQKYIVASWKRCMAVIMQILAIMFNGSAMASSHWIKVGNFRTGIFEKCTSRNFTEEDITLTLPDAPFPGDCGYSLSKGYVQLSAALQVIGGVCSLTGAVCNIFGLQSGSGGKKFMYYRLAMYLAFLGVMFQLGSLMSFPIFFNDEVKDLGREDYSWARSWIFGWAYILAWGAAICTFGAALLIFWDRNHDEIRYKQIKPEAV